MRPPRAAPTNWSRHVGPVVRFREATVNLSAGATICAFEASDEFGFGNNDQFEIAIVKVRGETLMLAISAPTANWDAARPALEAFLRSITFPPAGS